MGKGENHEFGIMPKDPVPGKRYDIYEPQYYSLTAVHDDFINEIAPQLNELDFYWHGLDFPGKGLAYYGTTLIPPTSMARFMEIIGGLPEFFGLYAMLEQALQQEKYIIHFGI